MPRGPFLSACLILAVFVIATHRRNEVWRDPVTLWQDTARKSPGNPRPLLNLAAALVERGQPEEARRLFERVLTMERTDGQTRQRAQINLAYLLIAEGKSAEALVMVDELFRTHPGPEAAHALALLALATGQPERALSLTEELVGRDDSWRTSPTLHLIRAEAFHRLKRCQAASEEYRLAEQMGWTLTIPDC